MILVRELGETNGLNLLRPPERPASIEGDLTAANAGELGALLRALHLDAEGRIELDLSGLEIEGGAATVAAVNALRELSARASKVVLIAAPQMLCHNLYRIGLLEGNVELREMRQDEPAGF